MTFSFYIETALDLGQAMDEFALPGRRIRLLGEIVDIEMTLQATEAQAGSEVGKYCQALRRQLGVPLRVRTSHEFATLPARHRTIQGANREERARISRAVRAARNELLTSSVDPALRQAYDYLQTARESDSAALPSLYKAMETIWHSFGGEKKAGKALGVSKQMKDVTGLSNAGVRDERHAPDVGESVLRITESERQQAMQSALAVVRAYEHHLGL